MVHLAKTRVLMPSSILDTPSGEYTHGGARQLGAEYLSLEP